MARVKRAVNAQKKRREHPRAGQRVPRPAVPAVPQGQGAGHPLGCLRLRPPQGPQGRLPPAVDPADQRGGPRERHDLQPVHPGPEPRRRRGGPSHARRAGSQRRAGFRHARGDRQGGSARCRLRPMTTSGPTSVKSDRVGAVRRLAQRKFRQQVQRFLVEGPQAVREAVRCHAGSLDEVFVVGQSALADEDTGGWCEGDRGP